MKKFLGKLPVMLTFVIVAVLVLGVYIGLLARPVATGMTYSYSMDADEYAKLEESFDVKVFKSFKTTQTMKFKNSKVIESKTSFDYKFAKDVDEQTQKTITAMFDEASKDVNTSYYFRVGNKIYTLMGDLKDDKAYDEAVKAFKSVEGWEKLNTFTVNAFTLKLPEAEELKELDLNTTYTCTGTIVLAVVLGVVEVALIAFSALSVVAFVGSKKKQA